MNTKEAYISSLDLSRLVKLNSIGSFKIFVVITKNKNWQYPGDNFA